MSSRSISFYFLSYWIDFRALLLGFLSLAGFVGFSEEEFRNSFIFLLCITISRNSWFLEAVLSSGLKFQMKLFSLMFWINCLISGLST